MTLGSPVKPFPIGLFIAGEELLPRRMLTSAGFAFKASDADSLGGSSPAAFDQSAHVADMSKPPRCDRGAGSSDNEALVLASSVAGKTQGVGASVSGGIRNEASARWAKVSGSADRISAGEADWRAGSLFENF